MTPPPARPAAKTPPPRQSPLLGHMRPRPLPYDAEAARRHLVRADPVMRDIIKLCGPFALQIRGDAYTSLMRAVLYQQLAGAAAAAIERRFLALFDGRIPKPEQVLTLGDDQFRAAGVSRQKAAYIRSIAEHFTAGHLSDRRLRRQPDAEVIAEVTQIKGIGEWTAHMLLMFCLGRPDVLPVGDYGIRNAMRLAYGLPDLPKPAEMERIAEPWRPYRTAGSWYLWRRSDIVTL